MLRVSAPTDELAKRYAQKVREEMEKHPAVIMTRFNWMEKTGALKVEIDNDKLRQMGIDRQTVSMALQAELSGYITKATRLLISFSACRKVTAKNFLI